MANLTETAVFSKRVINVTVSIIGISIIFFVAYRFGNTIKKALFPPPPAPAIVAFGKLPRINLSEGVKVQTALSYSIETVSGDLPNLSHEAKVFAHKPEESYFGALEATKTKVSHIGFSQSPIEISGNTAKFLDPKVPNRNLTINIVTGNFRFDSIFISDEEVLSGRPKSVEDAIANATNFLSAMEINLAEYPQNKIETFKYAISQGQLVETPALATANVVQVNFKRGNIDKFEVSTPRARESFIKVLVAADGVVVFAEVERNPVELYRFSSYPLKGTEKAFSDLKLGKGFFTRDPEIVRFPIRDVTLGYVDTKIRQEYFQPVYVFKSDDGLLAYVDAVDDSWIKD